MKKDYKIILEDIFNYSVVIKDVKLTDYQLKKMNRKIGSVMIKNKKEHYILKSIVKA